MFKLNLFKSSALTAALVCVFLLVSCGNEPTNENPEQTSAQTVTTAETVVPAPVTSVTEAGTEQPETSVVTSVTEPETSEIPAEDPDEEIAKINGGADDAGIYSVVVRLTDKAADKGTVEMVYYGEKGSPQENSIVNTFRIEYYKESDGTFEIRTFSNGEVYQNQHRKDEVKVVNTFDATLRAGNVIISYTPDGGETREIFKADADYFRS